jgi:type II secretory pathway component HofQ
LEVNQMKIMNKVMLMAALAAVMLVAAPLKANAHGLVRQSGQDVSQTTISSLNLQDVDIRDALRALFKYASGVSYVVGSEVQGTVTIELSNIKFEVALRNILDQVKATYRIEGGVYQIISRSNDPTVVPTDEHTGPPPTVHHTPVRIYLNHADPALIFRLLQGFGGTYPETSTLINGSMFGGGGQGGSGGLGGSGGRGGQGGGLGGSGGCGGGFGGGGIGGGLGGGGGIGGGGGFGRG